MKTILIKLIAVLAIASLACQININLPVARPSGETTTVTVSEPAPAGGQAARVQLDMGAGELILRGGSNELVSGTISYNLNEWEPKIERNGEVLRIYQDIDTIPFPRNDQDLVNQWDLQLGSTPMELRINAGAYDGNLDLGGVPLLSLDIRTGASSTVLSFDEPNPQEMTVFTLETGASSVELENLANANFRRMDFTGAAGDYTLDFGGDLRRDADVNINGAVGDVTVIVPAGQAAEVTVTGGLSDVNIRGSWENINDVYTLAGDGPVLTIEVEMSIGNLELISR